MRKKKNKSLTIFLKYAKEYRGKIILLAIVFFVFNTCFIFSGYLNGMATEAIVNLNLKSALLFLLVYFLIETIGQIVINVSYYFAGKIKAKITRKMSYDTYKKMMQLPTYAFEEMSSGEILNRVTQDTNTISDALIQLLSILSNILCTFLITIYILTNSLLVALEILIFLLIYACVMKYFNKRIKECDKKYKEKNDEYTAFTSESIRGVREIKTLGIIKNLSNSLAEIMKNLYTLSIKSDAIEIKYAIVSETLKMGLEVATLMTCAYLAYSGSITITFFIAMTYYIYRYTWLIQNITSFSKTYNKFVVSLNRVGEILSNELYEDVQYGNVSLKDTKGNLTFNHVSFSYKGEKELLHDFSISFTPNQKIAIVGPSGEGKSTLFNLITRLFEPSNGQITLDGIPLKELTEDSLRENIAIIRQEPFLFNKTILENFRLVKSDITIEEVRKYCKMAYIDDYIMRLKENYNTILGEGGVNLSGGQKQRLSIARAMLKNARVILFDEATSALDNESQEYIKKQMDVLAKGHTVLIIAHRLSTIKDADLIYVIQKGQVLASGTHQDLMKNCSFYRKLYAMEENAN